MTHESRSISNRRGPISWILLVCLCTAMLLTSTLSRVADDDVARFANLYSLSMCFFFSCERGRSTGAGAGRRVSNLTRPLARCRRSHVGRSRRRSPGTGQTKLNKTKNTRKVKTERGYMPSNTHHVIPCQPAQ
ncbi:hypothetical protein GGS23DRAFT_288138 [Durotheca rogersii]|uniref:uncharacterized protein n=1 Tax=Durotheca rogersii TaxID=419775 RepID=UPI0022208616|nr:uncharacterized protein GGS23DRAFT_288138 [Durotheca rogersii]KAI5866772.1 hypothetical protein GGS23DRAFT_288138 [Durotheca rogersii]